MRTQAHCKVLCFSTTYALLVTGSFSLLSPPVLATVKASYASKMQVGQQFFFNGDLQRAISAFNDAARLKPSAFEPHFNLVSIYMQKQDLEVAANEARLGLKIKPSHRDLHLLLGNLLRTMASSKEFASSEQKKLLEEALTEYSTAKELGVDAALADSNLSITFLQLENYEKAMEHIDKAIEKRDVLPDAHMIKGVLHVKRSQNAKNSEETKAERQLAKSCLDKAIKQKGKNAEARNIKAEIYFAEGKLEEALEEYKRALVDDELYVPARIGIANILISQQKWEEALRNLERVLELKPNDANILYSMGICLEKLEKIEPSILMFNQGMLVDTNPQTRTQIKTHVMDLSERNSFLNVPKLFDPQRISEPQRTLLGPGFRSPDSFLQLDLQNTIKMPAPSSSPSSSKDAVRE